MCPAAAKSASACPAIDASSAEKTSFGPTPGLNSSTANFAASVGTAVGNRHGKSTYRFPADRSLAASQVVLNHGCASSSAINCCPTVPVAPRIPTSIFAWECTYFPELKTAARSSILLGTCRHRLRRISFPFQLRKPFEQVLHQVLRILAPRRQPDQSIGQSQLRPRLRRNRSVRHRRRMAQQRLHSAQTFRQGEISPRLHERHHVR